MENSSSCSLCLLCRPCLIVTLCSLHSLWSVSYTHLYDVLIYSMKDGFEKARIIYADSGRLEMTADKQHLWLHLYSGDSVSYTHLM